MINSYAMSSMSPASSLFITKHDETILRNSTQVLLSDHHQNQLEEPEPNQEVVHQDNINSSSSTRVGGGGGGG